MTIEQTLGPRENKEELDVKHALSGDYVNINGKWMEIVEIREIHFFYAKYEIDTKPNKRFYEFWKPGVEKHVCFEVRDFMKRADYQKALK
ncbi:MAG: hypothetical protein WC438_04940 [Candidatus Pacearchaeota archaeon]